MWTIALCDHGGELGGLVIVVEAVSRWGDVKGEDIRVFGESVFGWVG